MARRILEFLNVFYRSASGLGSHRLRIHRSVWDKYASFLDSTENWNYYSRSWLFQQETLALDRHVATTLHLMNLFKKIRAHRSKLLAENNDESSASLVDDLTAAMSAIMKKIVSLNKGNLLPLTPATAPSNLFCVRLRSRFGTCFSIEGVLQP